MSGENPFAQWGYQHPFAPPDNDKPHSPTSIFGALPSGLSNYGFPMGPFSTGDSTQTSAAAASSNQSALAQMQITTFRFASPTNSVLNSTVVGPQGQKFFTVATHGVGNTVLVNEQASGPTRGEAVGTIEWQRTPLVSLVGSVARQSAGQWLAWSSDRKYRTMMARGREYNWIFNTGMFFLYTAGSSPSEFVARIVRGRDGEGILLDITSRAVQSGLLDVCVLAAILFSSGRSLD